MTTVRGGGPPISGAVLVIAMLLACGPDEGGDDVAGATTGGEVDGSGPADPTSTGSTRGLDDSSGAVQTGDTGDTGVGSSTGAPAIDYARQIQPIWDAACTCHLQGPSGMMTASTLTLTAGTSYAELVGAMATQAPLPRVAPGDLDGSYLWHKLQGTQAEVGGMGTAMPQVGTLSQADLDLVAAWIEGGASP